MFTYITSKDKIVCFQDYLMLSVGGFTLSFALQPKYSPKESFVLVKFIAKTGQIKLVSVKPFSSSADESMR